MTPQQAFGVAVRTIGLFVCVWSLYHLFAAAYEWRFPHGRGAETIHSMLLYGAASGIVGLFLLRGAPILTAFSYPATPAVEEDSVD